VELGLVGTAVCLFAAWRVAADLIGAHLLGRGRCPVGGGERDGARRREAWSVGVGLGAVTAVLALCVHSAFDFGARIPAMDSWPPRASASRPSRCTRASPARADGCSPRSACCRSAGPPPARDRARRVRGAGTRLSPRDRAERRSSTRASRPRACRRR
jgi:hypothetical protein